MMKINPKKQKYCKKIGYTIGSAGDVSYGEKYEFDTIQYKKHGIGRGVLMGNAD